MKRSEILFGLLRIPVDALMAIAALILAYQLRIANIDLIPTVQLLTNPMNLPPFEYYLSHFVMPSALGYIMILACFQLYALKVTLGPWREIARVLATTLLWFAGVIALFFLLPKLQPFVSRILMLHATVFLAFFTILGRTIVLLIQRAYLRRGIGVRYVMSCGILPLPASVVLALERDPRFRLMAHARSVDALREKRRAMQIDLVLHTDPNPESADTMTLIDYCRSRHIGYAFLPPVFTDVPHQLTIDHLGLTPMLRFEPTPLDGWGRVIKRLADLVFGILLLLILSPILLITALLILVTSGWPIFYISKRVGQYGRQRIPLFKFRTMCRDADAKKKDLAHLSHRTDGPLFKIKHDPRVTRLGRILRRLSIDELPQLLNVVAGRLSLVGPRPHLPDEVERYQQSERRVFTVRPGVTGLAQISGRSDLSFEEEVKLDMRYIEDWSIALDLWILWRTIFVVLKGGGAD